MTNKHPFKKRFSLRVFMFVTSVGINPPAFAGGEVCNWDSLSEYTQVVHFLDQDTNETFSLVSLPFEMNEETIECTSMIHLYDERRTKIGLVNQVLKGVSAVVLGGVIYQVFDLENLNEKIKSDFNQKKYLDLSLGTNDQVRNVFSKLNWRRRGILLSLFYPVYMAMAHSLKTEVNDNKFLGLLFPLEKMEYVAISKNIFEIWNKARYLISKNIPIVFSVKKSIFSGLKTELLRSGSLVEVTKEKEVVLDDK